MPCCPLCTSAFVLPERLQGAAKSVQEGSGLDGLLMQALLVHAAFRICWQMQQGPTTLDKLTRLEQAVVGLQQQALLPMLLLKTGANVDKLAQLTCTGRLQLSDSLVNAGNRQAERVHCIAHEVIQSSHFLEYIPGRDKLWTAEALAAGRAPARIMLCCAVLCRAVCHSVLCCDCPVPCLGGG